MRIILDSVLILIFACICSGLVGFAIGVTIAAIRKIAGTLKVASDGEEVYMFLEVEKPELIAKEDIVKLRVKRIKSQK